MIRALIALLWCSALCAQSVSVGGGPVAVAAPYVSTPIMHHSFNRNAGTGTTATSVLGPDAALTNVTWTEDPASSGHHALTFGSTTRAECGADLDGLNDFTVAAWAKLTTYTSTGGGTFGYLVIKSSGTNQVRSWFLRVGDTNDNLEAWVGDTSGTQLYDKFSSPTDSLDPCVGTSTWCHFAVVLTGCAAMGCSAQIYINGSAVTTTQDENNTGTRRNDAADTVRIGSFQGVGGFLNGSIDEVVVIPSAQNAGQIAALYAAGHP